MPRPNKVSSPRLYFQRPQLHTFGWSTPIRNQRRKSYACRTRGLYLSYLSLPTCPIPFTDSIFELKCILFCNCKPSQTGVNKEHRGVKSCRRSSHHTSNLIERGHRFCLPSGYFHHNLSNCLIHLVCSTGSYRYIMFPYLHPPCIHIFRVIPENVGTTNRGVATFNIISMFGLVQLFEYNFLVSSTPSYTTLFNDFYVHM